MEDAVEQNQMVSNPFRTFVLLAALTVSWHTFNKDSFAQMSSGLSRHAPDPTDSVFGTTDPVTSSLRATDQLDMRFQEQQHRLQTDSNRRQLRTKRPEPGESEVTREEEGVLLGDPLRHTLRNILPRDH